MERKNISRFITKLYAWYIDEEPLSSAEFFLGAPTQTLFDLLWDNTLIDVDVRPTGGVSFQHILDVILLYVAMRKGF